MPAPTPPVLPQPFANNATGGTINTIPNTTLVPGRASYDLGFPTLTMQPIIAGGIPPQGQDFNGILYALSSHAYYAQAGQPYLYDATVAAAIGGYGVGTVLGMSDGTGLWINQTAANMTDPDAGGAGWVPALSYGTTAITTTGGTTTLTTAQARRNIIVVTGALVSNAAINFPATAQRWLIINGTTGAFTLTVKTVAGSGVIVPQGGYGAPLEVYGQVGNLYPAVSPTVLPTDVAPTPNTIALRTAAAYLYATYFNQSSPLENAAVTAVFFQNGSDGFLRKISLANFLLQAFADAALTGTPTAPTATAGTNTTQIATTAFVQAALIGGAGQTWQDVTGSRALNTPFVNTTGRPISVNFSINVSPGQNCFASVDGVVVGQVGAATPQISGTISFVVPNGGTYSLNTGTGITSLIWAELR